MTATMERPATGKSPFFLADVARVCRSGLALNVWLAFYAWRDECHEVRIETEDLAVYFGGKVDANGKATTRGAVFRALGELRDLGLIDQEREGRCNVYRVLIPGVNRANLPPGPPLHQRPIMHVM